VPGGLYGEAFRSSADSTDSTASGAQPNSAVNRGIDTGEALRDHPAGKREYGELCVRAGDDNRGQRGRRTTNPGVQEDETRSADAELAPELIVERNILIEALDRGERSWRRPSPTDDSIEANRHAA
jgi:hypothetical protein